MRFGKIFVLLLVAVMVINLCPAAIAANNPVEAEFYINPVTGNDKNSGKQNAPFKTVERAVKAVSAISKTMKGNIYVYFADGRHELSAPVKFEKASGGHNGFKVIYTAQDGAKPVISGGKQVTGWELYDEEKNIYKASTGGAYSRNFVVDGALATRARSEKGLDGVRLDYGKTGLTCTNMELLDWKNKDEIEIVAIDKFMNKRNMVKKIRRSGEGRVQLVLSDSWDWANGTNKWVAPTYLENAYELLDAEGEFYIDSKKGEVYYKPLEGQNINEVTAVIPVLEELFVVGGYDYYRRTENIEFSGLEFTDTTWMYSTKNGGFYPAQDGYVNVISTEHVSSWLLVNPAAITVSKSCGIDIIGCDFKALGASAIRVLEGSEKVDIIGNHIRDLAAGAMFIGNVRRTEENPKDKRRVVKDINVKNNYIHHVAKVYTASAAFSAGYPYNLSVMHNEIHDVPYSGAHIGWGWGVQTEKTLKNFNFEYNYIHDFQKGEGMGDGGGIYTLGYTTATAQEPNQISRNYFRDNYTSHPTAGGMIYLDNTSSNYIIEGNVLDNRGAAWYTSPNAFANSSYTTINNLWKDNFSTIPVKGYTNKLETNIIFENNQYFPDANWPEQAREVIRKSGLEPEWQHLSPRSKEFARVFTDEFVNLTVGDKYRLTPSLTTEFCEEIDTTKPFTITYKSENEEVATVGQDGTITALKNGQAKIITEVTVDSITKSVPTTVSIGKGLGSVKFNDNIQSKIVIGESKELPTISGISYAGNEVEGEIKNPTWKSSDENVLSIDLEKHTMTAKNYGEAVITYSAEYEGVTKTAEHKITVIDYADQAGLNYPTVSVEDLVKEPDDWYVALGNIIKIPNGFAFEDVTTGQYSSKKFENEIFDFYMSLDKWAIWPSITLRNQEYGAGFSETNSFYIISFARGDGIELQRFNGNARTSIFCNLLPITRIGPTTPTVLAAKQKYHIQVGTITEENGVRIILNVDGKNIINYLDETEGRIDEPGYFGVMINSTTMRMTTK